MEIAIAIIGSGVLTKLLDMILDYVKNKKNPMRQGLRLCLLKDMTDYGNALISKGEVTQMDIKQFNEMYDTYKALDGDGYADVLKENVTALPLKV